MKEYKKIYDECFENLGYLETFPKEHARILWNINLKNGEVKDLLVEDFKNCEEKQYLYKEYNLDIGNCLSDWDGWTLTDVLLKIFCGNDVIFDLRKKVLLELSKVEEWRPELAPWIYRNFGQ